MASQHISARAKNISESVTLSIVGKVKALKREGVKVIGFGAGEPDFDTPQNIKDAGIRAISDGHTKYAPVNGIADLKEAICRKFKKDNSLSYSPDQIIVSNGAKHSLHNALQAILNPGDEVLVPTPYWVSYPEMVSISGGKSIFVKTDDAFELSADHVAACVTPKTRALFLNSPSNPTGATIPEEEIRKIAEVAVEKGFIVISDEIYEKIVFDGKHVSIASFGDDIKAQTIVINGVSKAYSMTGWRIGYAAGPADIIKAMGRVQSHATSSPNTMAQDAAVEALNGPQDEVETMRREFEKRRDFMVKRLNGIKGITCNLPKGTFYAFPDVSGICKDSLEFADKLLETQRVAVVPGIAFGAEGFVRLSYATSMENIKEGLDRIEEFAKGF